MTNHTNHWANKKPASSVVFTNSNAMNAVLDASDTLSNDIKIELDDFKIFIQKKQTELINYLKQITINSNLIIDKILQYKSEDDFFNIMELENLYNNINSTYNNIGKINKREIYAEYDNKKKKNSTYLISVESPSTLDQEIYNKVDFSEEKFNNLNDFADNIFLINKQMQAMEKLCSETLMLASKKKEKVEIFCKLSYSFVLLNKIKKLKKYYSDEYPLCTNLKDDIKSYYENELIKYCTKNGNRQTLESNVLNYLKSYNTKCKNMKSYSDKIQENLNLISEYTNINTDDLNLNETEKEWITISTKKINEIKNELKLDAIEIKKITTKLKQAYNSAEQETKQKLLYLGRDEDEKEISPVA